MKKRIYICSPLRGNVEANIQRARRLCLEAIEQGVAPFAPHAFYPLFMDPEDPDQDQTSIECGLEWLNACNEVWVDSRDGTTAGMETELRIAKVLQRPIVYPAWKTPALGMAA